ncbi:hypothetical protein J6590_061371 [Homalodisca vitripennis]|nr:hypothetical protein J6590_061371 [Homalodisca vitripennis]
MSERASLSPFGNTGPQCAESTRDSDILNEFQRNWTGSKRPLSYLYKSTERAALPFENIELSRKKFVMTLFKVKDTEEE